MRTKNIRIAILLILVICIASSVPYGLEREVDSAHGLMWVSAKNYTYDAILGEDETHLFIQATDDLLVIDKGLAEQAEMIEDYPLLDDELYKAYTNRAAFKRVVSVSVPDESIKYENSMLAINGLNMVDMTTYEEADDEFYANSSYERSPILYFANTFDLGNDTQIYSVRILTHTYIPAPYTPVATENYWVGKGVVRPLSLGSTLSINEVVECDGNLIIAGAKREWKYTVPGFVYVMTQDGTVMSLNDELNAESIELLDVIDGKAYFTSYVMDQSTGIATQCKTFGMGNGLTFSELPNVSDIYKSRDGQVFTINQSGNMITNVTQNLQRDTSEFSEEIALYKALDEAYN